MLQIAGATMQTVQGTVRLNGSPSDSAAVIDSGTGSPSIRLCAGLPGEEPDDPKATGIRAADPRHRMPAPWVNPAYLC